MHECRHAAPNQLQSSSAKQEHACSVGASRRNTRRRPWPLFKKLCVWSRAEPLLRCGGEQHRDGDGRSAAAAAMQCNTCNTPQQHPAACTPPLRPPPTPSRAHLSSRRLMDAARGFIQRSTALCSRRRLAPPGPPSPSSSPAGRSAGYCRSSPFWKKSICRFCVGWQAVFRSRV